jgi:hypothetical protein
VRPHDGPGEDLDATECRRLLGTARIGRLSFTDGAMPAIVPVPFAMHDEAVLIPAHRDGDLVRGVRGSVVALGVDSYRDVPGPGWNVTVVGPSRVLGDARSVARIDALGLFDGRSACASWCYISVQLSLIRGRRTDRPS